MTIRRLLPPPEDREDPPRRRGRPRLTEGENAGVYVRFPASDFDRLDNQARERGISIPEFIRRRLSEN